MTEREPLLYPGPRIALLRRVAKLSIDDLHRLDAAVVALVAEKNHKHVDKGFVFAWWAGPRFQGDDDLEIQDLFASVVAAIASGLTGLDVERVGARFAPKPSGMGSIFRMVLPPRPSRDLQDASIGLIRDAVAPWDPRRAIVATWNMACAVALRDHLPADTVDTLEAAWRRAMGDLPA